MKHNQIKKLAEKYLLPEMPDFVVHKNDLQMIPLEHLSRGFSFQSSLFSKGRFTISAFVQPLYVPKEYKILTYGGRLGTLNNGPEKWWNLENHPEEVIFSEVRNLIHNEGLPFLEKLNSPSEFARYYLPKAKSPNIWQMEAVGFSLVFANKFNQAKAILEENCTYLVKAMKEDIYDSPHYPMIYNRDMEILRCLDEDVDQAFSLLAEWEEYTLEKLGLKR
jgi:hypothetical protein